MARPSEKEVSREIAGCSVLYFCMVHADLQRQRYALNWNSSDSVNDAPRNRQDYLRSEIMSLASGTKQKQMMMVSVRMTGRRILMEKLGPLGNPGNESV